MRLYAHSANKILFISLFLSFGIHFLVGRFVVVGFQVLPEPNKPSMIFHGSFLTPLEAQGKSDGSEKIRELPGFTWKDFSNTPYPRAQLPKPQLNESASLQPKQTAKSTFDLGTIERAGAPSHDDLGIDTEIKPYEPLRFETK